MSLFYENKKQDLKGEFVYEIDSKRDYAFRNKLVMEVDGYEYEKDEVIVHHWDWKFADSENREENR